MKSTDDTQDEIPAETKSPEDIPADIVWADPAVKYIIYSVYLNDDEFSAFCDENHDAASDRGNSPEGFWAFVNLFDAYIEKKDIHVTKRFLDSIREFYIYRISDSWAVEIRHNDPAFKLKYPCLSACFPLEISINSLADFAHMENLEALELSYTDITDLSPLKELEKLKILGLHTAQITDLSPLTDYPALIALDIDCKKAEDLSIISQMDELEILSLATAQDPDFSFLQNMSNLKELHLYDGQGINVEALAASAPPSLTLLRMDSCGIKDVAPLSCLTQLEVIELPRNQISDLSPLSGLTKIKRLYMPYNKVEDISALAGMKEIEELYLEGNDISDITIVSELKELRELSLSFNNIEDLSPIDSLEQLKSTFVSGNPGAGNRN